MKPNLAERFRSISSTICDVLASPPAFLGALMLIVLLLVVGPHFKFSAKWQMVVDFVTSIGPFLWFFLIQNSQNRETKAINLKLDALIAATEKADNKLIGHEGKKDAEVKSMRAELAREG